MAFSFRKMFSNIYFKKPDYQSENKPDSDKKVSLSPSPENQPVLISFERQNPDPTILSASLKLPASVKKYMEKKGSLSDTDLLTINIDTTHRGKRRRNRKLKLDICKASQSANQLTDESFNLENTPRKLLLDGIVCDELSKRFKVFDFNKSFDLYDDLSDEHPSTPFDEELSLDSYSECSESDISIVNESPIKMCRKVNDDIKTSNEDKKIISISPVSFADIELEKSSEEQLKLILNYQLRLEEIEGLMKKMLSEFQFHLNISKAFRTKSMAGSLKSLEKISLNENRGGPSPAGSWNIITNHEELIMRYKFKQQLWTMKCYIEKFVQENLPNIYHDTKKCLPYKQKVVFDLGGKHKCRVSNKKKIKHFDYPDIRDAMINLFLEKVECDESDSVSQCNCNCHDVSDDSGQNSKADEQSFSITSSIGNFSLDSSMLTIFSESLDQFVSYNSFEDISLYNSLLQIPTIDRIKFYIQVHSIELKSEINTDIETKNTITFHCPPCKYTETEEDGLLGHILSQSHCQKIHFLYKTAYIKKCVASGKEIQPSTVLNPMTMYRDENKIVCFGDAVYACTLCFENDIIGESILMGHCSEPTHIDRRERLADIEC